MSKRLSTRVDIRATPERVWDVLTDLAAYPAWNPFIVRAEGTVEPGHRLSLTMQPVGGRAMTLRPRLVEVAINRELRWRGKLGIPGLMDAEHTFMLQPQASQWYPADPAGDLPGCPRPARRCVAGPEHHACLRSDERGAQEVGGGPAAHPST